MSSVGSDDEQRRRRSDSDASDLAKEASSSRPREDSRNGSGGDKGKSKSRRRHSDEDDDEEGSEEDEESDEEDDEEEGGRRKRKRRRQGGNRFLDVEAEVDDDEEEFEEEDADFGKEDGFIEADVDSATGDDAVRRREAADHQRLDRMRREQEDRTAEEVAAELNQRYRRTTVTGRSEYSEIPQRMLMPSVQDPSLYSVRCKAGREKEIVMTMMRRVFKLAEQGKDTGLISCFFRDSLPSRVYMEARSSKDIVEACLEVTGVYARSQDQLFLVPIDEMADLLRITKISQEIKAGSWVRMKRGRYAGDLGSVKGINQTGDLVDVRFVPRIDMNPRSEGEFTDSMGRKRKKGAPSGSSTIKDRPPAKFFNYDEICRTVGNRDRPILRAGKYEYKGDIYINGYCEKEFRATALITENVNPTLDEIARFMGDSSGDGEAFDRAGLESLAQATKAKADVVLRSGDQVEVFEGEQAGIHGTVHTVGVDVISLRIDIGEKTEQVIEVPVSAVHKRFMPGDHIKVMNGQHRDETGLVVKVERNVTTFISDLTLQEISVFSKDIHEAAEVGSGITTVGQYELHDLVQLDAQTAACIFKIERGNFLVLDQMGNVRSIQPHQITMKRDANKAVALDSEGGEFRKGDTMKEVDHEERDGQVLHVYQSMLVWLFNRDLRENDGVFMVRARQLRPKAPRSAVPLTDLSKQNPALQAIGMPIANAKSGGASSNLRRPTGRDELVGKTVAITRGPYKTYRGIIKETNGPMARVELHTMSKILPIDISWLIEKDPITGASKPLMGRGTMGPPGTPGSATPFTSGGGSATPYGGGSKTPAYGGSKTPAYGGAGGKTPAYGAGGKTPAYGYNDGGKTPAYGYNDGGRTPAYGYNDGGRTPAFGGGRTPAQGIRTPAYGAGNRTPAYGGGSRTPAHGAGANDGSRTPAYGALGSTSNQWNNEAESVSPNPWSNQGRSAGTPMAPPSNPYGAPTPMAAPTPGAYPSAPTPAAATPGAPRAPYAAPTPGAPTPAAYGSAPTPGAAAAPTPGGPGWGPTPGAAWGEAPTPAGGWGAPTPGALGAPTPGGAVGAPTPAAGSAWSVPPPRSGSKQAVQIIADILVHVVADANGASFESGRYDEQPGSTLDVSGDAVRVRLDDGTMLNGVPTANVRPQRPRRGAVCRLLRQVDGNALGARVTVQNIDGEEVMAFSDGGDQFFSDIHSFALAS